MPHRYAQPSSLFPFVKLRPFAALREKLKEGYTLSDFRADVMAGAVVGMVAIPLGMAFAVGSDVAPQHGLYTVIVAGILVALLGGCRNQVSGPTAAFVVLAPIVHNYGLGGLLLAGMMAGMVLTLMGLARFGRFIQFIPHPVTSGFTAGIALVIASLQFKDFLGLKVAAMPERFIEKMIVLVRALPTFSPYELGTGLFTLVFLILWPRFNKRVPAPLVALTVAAIIVVFLKKSFGIEIGTIGDRFHWELNGITGKGIPPAAPHFVLPWNLPGPGGKPLMLSIDLFESLIPPAFAIAMLAAIETLLSAVMADAMTGTKHDPDAELVALGTGNIVTPFLGGIPATGALARTATNIRFGSRSPLSAVIHGVLTLIVILFFSRFVSYLPVAGLAALLMLVAYNMSEAKHFIHVLRVSPKSDVIVLLLCFSLTVIFDMVVGVIVGVVLAALLFMQRMAELTHAHVLSDTEKAKLPIPEGLPREILVYEIEGPLFFGAAQNAVGAITGITDHIKAVILVMEEVPVMDVTGLVALESSVKKLISQKRTVYVAGVKKQPSQLIRKSDLVQYPNQVFILKTLEEAIALAKVKVAPPSTQTSTSAGLVPSV